ncbi:hypothetical protein GH714_029005 [Hevea brasiliensis]|uniref:Uncharacterized protein n=1 Tax=Hevea brasiliensis TaxID=3981 RepID=A0A6A6LTA9_HEVBR|nr:hypothetical protein GH714_029005 [Hevea brasiliensis]
MYLSFNVFYSKQRRYNEADAEENAQAAEIERRIEQETKAEKHSETPIACGFDESELKSYISVIHANVYQTIKILHDGSKELAQNEADSSKYVICSENKDIGEKLSEIGGRLDYPFLTNELAQETETLWKDTAIQETYTRGNELQVPDCAHYFMENLQRLSDPNYIPTKEDVLYARVRTTGVVEIQFSPVGENKRSGEVYRLFDVGGQRNERRKWIHLFEGVTAVIFCAAISEYDQTLFEDENKNRMMETKELFEWVLKQPCFEVPLNVCEWFKDYQPVSMGKQEIEHAYDLYYWDHIELDPWNCKAWKLVLGLNFKSVLVGTGSRTMKIIKIKSLKMSILTLVCEKLGPMYASVPANELIKCRDFYEDLLREDTGMTVWLVINCNGMKINAVKNAFEKSLRARLLKTNPDTDYSCMREFGSFFTKDIPLPVGTTVDFR